MTLPRGTQVMVDGGPKFATDRDARLAPSIPARVGVTAVEAGTSGNVPAGSIALFSGPELDRLEVTNQRPTTGGTDRQARVILDEDKVKLRDQLTRQARDQAFNLLRARAGSERTLPDASLRIRLESEQYDQAPGTESEQITGRMTVTATATAFQNLAFNDLVGRLLAASGGPDARLSGAATIGIPTVQGVEGQKVKLRTQASGIIEQQIDREEVMLGLRGKSVDEARTYLRKLTGLSQAPSIEMSPSWAPRAFRVELRVQGPK